MYINNMKSKSGFSLIELLIFVSVIAVFFVVGAAVSIASLRSMILNEHKILATHYSEELLEWLNTQKEIDWNLFAEKAAAISGASNTCANVSSCSAVTYCFNTSPINITSLSGWPAPEAGLNPCPQTSLNPGIYSRELTLSVVNCSPGVSICQSSQINVTINTGWTEIGTAYSAPINTVFSVWEQ